MKQKRVPAIPAVALACAALPAAARSAGDWTLDLGVHQVLKPERRPERPVG